jgi:hypothetical protein
VVCPGEVLRHVERSPELCCIRVEIVKPARLSRPACSHKGILSIGLANENVGNVTNRLSGILKLKSLLVDPVVVVCLDMRIINRHKAAFRCLQFLIKQLNLRLRPGLLVENKIFHVRSVVEI